MKEYYRMTPKEVCKALNTNEDGLTEHRAEQIIKEKGLNVLSEAKKKKPVEIFFSQFADLLVIILIIAAVISAFSGNIESTIVILIVIIMNSILGTVQYVKAEKSLASLKALSSPHTKVVRDKKIIQIKSQYVVPGDVMLIEAGDMVTADGRILESYSLQVNESSLTGESASVDKVSSVIDDECPLADRVNMVYSGSLVSYGRAKVLVTETGMNTQMGHIAALMNNTKEKKTPLQRSLDDFGKKLAFIIMIISAIVFILRLIQKEPVIDSLMFAVALAVAAIPEALSSIVTIVQAMGTQKMAADNAVMKELKAVESLGCVSVICSDKTGTLTQNKMTVQDVYIDGHCIKPDELDLGRQLHRYLIYISVLSNDSTIQDGKGIGDPTEYCLLEMARKAGLERYGILEDDIRRIIPRMEEIPFDSDRKLMSTRCRLHGVPMVLTKGAVDVLLDRTINIMEGEKVRPITDKDKQAILQCNRHFSENGLRVLAFAIKETAEDEKLTADNENGYTFIGLVSIEDPPRSESAMAVKEASDAGIKTVMITGDHKVTAVSIAKRIGIYKDGDMALTGQELDALSDEQLDAVIENVSVYARVSPKDKIRIVEHWQKRGNIVAMTGDGVNDAPALKKADIGVAMGITGTEVSKDAAAMILSDDNFATIIGAVLNGRNVYRNIKNAIQFLLSGNLAAIIAVLFCSIASLPVPFKPVHLLFINLLTDSLPALAIGMEPVDKSLLKEKPRNPKEGILTKDFLIRLAFYGGLISVSTLTAFYIGLGTDSGLASTMAFAVLTQARLFHGFSCRSDKSLAAIGIKSNMWSVGAFVLGTLLLMLALMLPVLRPFMEVSALDMTHICYIAVLSVIPTVIIQIIRLIRGK